MPRSLSMPESFREVTKEKKPRRLDVQKLPSRLRSLISAPIKGLVKGIGEIGESAVPLIYEDEPFEERQKLIQQAKEAKERFEQGPLEKILPTQEGFLEKSLERAGKILPYAAFGGASGISRAALGGFAGQAVEEFGGSPFTQALAEIGAQGAPGLGKKILAKNPQQKGLIDFARKVGLSEKEIAPLIHKPSRGKKLIAKFSGRGEKIQERLQSSRKASGNIYNTLKTSPEAQQRISPENATTYLNEMSKVLKDMPYNVRKQIFHDAMDLIKSGGKGSDIINFYQDINSNFPRFRALGSLLAPTEKAIASISAELAKDFGMANQLFKQGLQLRKMLKPEVLPNLLKAGKQGLKIAAILTKNPFYFLPVIGGSAVKKLGSEMLTNPRFQNLTIKMIHALNNNKITLAKEIADQLLKEDQE